jgi:hypothetical protein
LVLCQPAPLQAPSALCGPAHFSAPALPNSVAENSFANSYLKNAAFAHNEGSRVCKKRDWAQAKKAMTSAPNGCLSRSQFERSHGRSSFPFGVSVGVESFYRLSARVESSSLGKRRVRL